jgi:gliding motility-associated-like protein
MTKIGCTFVFSVFVTFTFFSQQLIINEVSQGVGSSEYVEFVVIGSVTCATPVPCIDLRKVIIDDNNGYFAPGSGTGIAAGAVRFANIDFWSCIPQGTYIVIYNELSPNGSLPPDDSSISDGNCKLILPATSNLLEMTTVSSPSTTTNLYPSDASWAIGGSWAPLAMSNSNDSFQIPNLAVNGTPLHAVSWGNNSTNAIIYFAGAATSKVYSFTNAVSNDWNNQLNWEAGDAGVNETPGYANGTANDNWLATMNPQCGVALPMVLSPTVSNPTCFALCDGSASVSILNGTAPYTYLWQNGAVSQTATDLCSGTYSLTVTDFGGCEQTVDVTVNEGVSAGNPSINAVSQMTISDTPLQITATTAGGAWTSDCGSCLSSTGVFNPQLSGIGIFEVCHEIGSGSCAASACISVEVVNDCSILVSPTVSNPTCFGVCDGSASVSVSNGTAPYMYLWQNGAISHTTTDLCAGTYSLTVTDFTGCEQTIDVIVNDGASAGNPSIGAVSQMTISDTPLQITATTSGGTWTSDCGSCLSSTGVFNPQLSGIGIFEVCQEIGSAACAASACISIEVVNNCLDQVVNQAELICPGDSVLIFDQWQEVGVYQNVFTSVQGCDSTVTIRVDAFSTVSLFENAWLCAGDSMRIFGSWTSIPGTYSDWEEDNNGCAVLNTVTIFQEECEREPFLVYIPNSFTPNSDGVNDFFTIQILGGVVTNGFIVNRWGNIIASFSENEKSWNGKNGKGEFVQDGIYTYVVNCISYENERVVKTGSVTLFK